MQKRYTDSAIKAMEAAKKAAKSLGHNYVGTEHLLIGLLKTKGVAAEVLKENGVEEEKIRSLMEDLISTSDNVMVTGNAEFTPRARKIIENSISEAERLGTSKAGTEHLLLSILKETDCISVRILST